MSDSKSKIHIDAKDFFSFVFGWIGLLSGILFFINPFFTVYNLYTGAQEIKNLTSGLDLLFILFTTLFWITSDTIAGQDFTISSDKFSQNNLIGFNLTLIAIIFYLYYYVSEFQRFDQSKDLYGKITEVRVYKTNYLKYAIFLVSLLDVIVEVLIAGVFTSIDYGHNESNLKKGKYIFKGIALGINFLMYMPSWIKIIKNIRQKKYEQISMPGYILGLVRYGSWVGYGASQYAIYNKLEIERDQNDYLFILFGNLMFFIMCVVFICLYLFVVKKNEEVSDIKPPEPDKINQEDNEVQYEDEDEED